MVGLALERKTTGGLSVFEIADSHEVAIDKGRGGKRPQMFGRRQLGRVGWLEQQARVLRDI